MTIKDIARLSGYGVSTVSRALNGHPDISEETRKKIQRIVSENNFVPNANARQLKQSKSNNLAIIVKGNVNFFFAVLIEGLQRYLEEYSTGATVHYLTEHADEMAAAQKVISEQKPTGVIFLGGDLVLFQEGIKKISVPCVLCTVNGARVISQRLSSVCVDDKAMSKIAIDYLIKAGHSEIGILSASPQSFNTPGLRIAGCKESFFENNLPFNQKNIYYCDFSLKSAYEATAKLLKERPEITAIFAMSDIMAIAAMSAIGDIGKKIPEDVSVMGFDGIELGRYCSPKLTTVVQPAEVIAKTAVKQIMGMINKTKPATHILLDGELYEGGSIKGAPKGN